ncbi:histidine-rich glycoprotein-like [Punica granatum]|uniref:Uncharacterized protein n=2 Tax=Punica granatum TaxID=22663 RepID=A0A218WCP0_PUNGR|nr:histidine-rich glycoprotein-like [Punica granatum]OWM70426.1 hypothetical protein CDL15_Pgr011902 [Punica granatum]PKI44517.1 hypothetical protein CRG98_035104 [Punica granatum]
MSRIIILVALLGLVAAAAADFAAEPPHFRHRPRHEHMMPPVGAPRSFPEHKLLHDSEHGPGPRPGPFVHPPRMAGAPDHMAHHHHGAHPPMMEHGHGPNGKVMPPSHAPQMHPHHHDPLAPAY